VVNPLCPLWGGETFPPLNRTAIERGQQGERVKGTAPLSPPVISGILSLRRLGSRKRKISLPLGKGAIATEKSPLSLSFRAKREIPQGERVLPWGSLRSLRSVGMTEKLTLGRDDREAIRGEAHSTAWHFPEMVRRLLAFPFGGKDERTVSKQHSCCFECAERSGRMVRAPAVTEPPVALAGGETRAALPTDG